MILYLTAVLVLLVKSTLSQSVLEVVGATNDTNTINVQKGENLTLTCRSDLESLTLEYASVIYSDTKMINGSYTVSFTKIAVRDDDNQLVTCRATNATGESLKIEAKVRVQVDVKITLNGVKNLTEGDTANISCTVSGSLYEPSSVMFVCISSACTSLMNQTSQTINTVYDNASETFTTVLQAAPFSVTSDLNEVWIICPVSLNGSVLFSRDNVSVFYGPYQDSVYLTGSSDWYEGYPGGLTCYSTLSNPAVTLTWYNGSTVFSPDSPVSVIKRNSAYGYYETREEWDFKYSRYFSGSNISCVARGHQNKTVIKTRQFGVIHFAPELVILGNSIIDEGDTLNLTCEVIAASPMTNASWGPIGNGSDELVIANVQRNQDGNYYNCFAENLVRKSYKDVRLTVQYGPDISLSWIRTVNEGTSLTIQPYIRGNPEPVKFTWKREGSDAVVSTDKNLLLENATREQAGVYIFEATSVRQRENNATEEVTGNASIIVEVKYGLGESLSLSPNISVIEFNEGDPVPQITCLADCVPECDFKWNQYYRNTMRHRSINAVLDLDNASSALVGIYMCEAIYNGDQNRIRRNVTFELRVKYKPKIESVAVNDFNINLYSEGTPITTTAKVRAYPAAKLTWGIRNDRFTNQFLPLDSRYSVNQSVECSYDCEVTETLTLSSASCTDTGNKFSVYAENEKGNSTVQSVLNSIYVGCSPCPLNSSLTNQTYSTCEGEELNMTASFLSNPGPWMGWYLSPDTSGIPLYYTDERGFGSIIHHTNYHIPFVYKYMFGAWIVEAENYGGGPVGRAYIEVVQHPNCSGNVHSTFSVPHTTTSVQSTTLSAGNMAPSQGSGQTGVIVGSVIGSLLLIAIIVGGAIVFMRHRKNQKGNIKLHQFDLGMTRKT